MSLLADGLTTGDLDAMSAIDAMHNGDAMGRTNAIEDASTAMETG